MNRSDGAPADEAPVARDLVKSYKSLHANRLGVPCTRLGRAVARALPNGCRGGAMDGRLKEGKAMAGTIFLMLVGVALSIVVMLEFVRPVPRRSPFQG
jgi:hypothetical protein